MKDEDVLKELESIYYDTANCYRETVNERNSDKTETELLPMFGDLVKKLGIAELKLSGLSRKLHASMVKKAEKAGYLNSVDLKLSNIRGWKKRALDFYEKATC